MQTSRFTKEEQQEMETQLKAEIDAFFLRGGQINVVPPGLTSNDMARAVDKELYGNSLGILSKPKPNQAFSLNKYKVKG